MEIAGWKPASNNVSIADTVICVGEGFKPKFSSCLKCVLLRHKKQ